MSVTLSRSFAAFAAMTSGLLPLAAQAAQGPGTGQGSASPSVQLAMAVAVYGCAGLMIAAGLLGALRQAR